MHKLVVHDKGNFALIIWTPCGIALQPKVKYTHEPTAEVLLERVLWRDEVRGGKNKRRMNVCPMYQ